MSGRTLCETLRACVRCASYWPTSGGGTVRMKVITSSAPRRQASACERAACRAAVMPGFARMRLARYPCGAARRRDGSARGGRAVRTRAAKAAVLEADGLVPKDTLLARTSAGSKVLVDEHDVTCVGRTAGRVRHEALAYATGRRS